MNSTLLPYNGLTLLNLIDSYGTLEWRKYQDSHKKVFVGVQLEQVSCPEIPPYCSFRFVKEDPDFVTKLARAVENYDGKIGWVMVSRSREGLSGRNWMICPKRYWEIRALAEHAGKTPGQFLAELDPSFGAVAHDDFEGLCRFVEIQLNATPDH